MSEIGYLTSDEEIAEILSSRIKDERIAQGVKQKDLAIRAGVGVHVIRNFEQSSRITLINLIAIIRSLRKTSALKELFDFKRERIELDAFEYADKIIIKGKKRVRDVKQ